MPEAYNPATYVSGGPWETIEHFQRAVTAPRIVETLSSVSDTTTPSFFEYRDPNSGNERRVDLAILKTGAGTFTAILERSFDYGVTWVPEESFTAPVAKHFYVNSINMLRVRLGAIGAATTITVSLIQHL